jgi:hypothetical protein
MEIETKSIVNKSILKNLLKETHETLATNLVPENLKANNIHFTIVDLWKIQKAKRSTQNWRRSFNSSY